MRNNTIELGDSKGRVCKIIVWTPSNWTNLKFWNSDKTRWFSGDWRSIDKGLIRYNSGDVYLAHFPSDPNNAILWIGLAGNFDGMADRKKPTIHEWPGIVLSNYEYWNGTNANGSGRIAQTWVLGLEPGDITWSRIDD